MDQQNSAVTYDFRARFCYRLASKMVESQIGGEAGMVVWDQLVDVLLGLSDDQLLDLIYDRHVKAKPRFKETIG